MIKDICYILKELITFKIDILNAIELIGYIIKDPNACIDTN